MYERTVLVRWLLEGRNGPAPHIVKQWAVTSYAAVHSIELDRSLYEQAVRRFRRFPHIHIHLGDSRNVLERMVAAITEPALFWLDGHYSGPGTARGATDTPVLQELAILLKSGSPAGVILIDDARLFNGGGGYPHLKDIERTVAAARPDSRVHVLDDIIRIGF